MSKEAIKTIILTLLVSLSAYLTWNIWTFSPNIKPFNEDEKDFIQNEVAIKNTQMIENIIKPHQIMFHQNEKHYGSYAEKDINQMVETLSSWTLYDYKDISTSIATNKFQNLLYKDGISEFIFSERIPLSIYEQVVKIEDRELRDDIEFDRILIEPRKANQHESRVYFVLTEERKVYQFSVNADNLDAFTRKTNSIVKNLPTYNIKKITENKYFYLPTEDIEINQYKYLIEDLDPKSFKDALFTDPSSVKREYVTGGQEFSDGLSKMKVSNESMILSYIDPPKNKSNKEYTKLPSDILEKSIDYVNDHSGWDDNNRYRFTELYELNNKTTTKFRLYIQGLPAFNEKGMAEVTQDWENDSLTRYTRPIFSLDIPLTEETIPVKLPSGEKALKLIQEQANIDEELIEEITLGFKLNKDLKDSRIVSLKPDWFYRYNGEWKSLTSDKSGGMLHGLE